MVMVECLKSDERTQEVKFYRGSRALSTLFLT